MLSKITADAVYAKKNAECAKIIEKIKKMCYIIESFCCRFWKRAA
jgi:hypothetical protein